MIAIARNQPNLDELEKNPFENYSRNPRPGFSCDLITFPEAAVVLRFDIHPDANVPPRTHNLSQIQRNKILKNLTRGKTDYDIIVELYIYPNGLQYFDRLPELLDDKAFLETIFGKTLSNFMEICRRFRNVFLTKWQQQIP